jgi:hypothetical protein
MNSKFVLTKRKKLILATVIICAVLIAGLTILRQGGPVTQAAIVQPNPGIVGLWHFDEGSGTVAGDSSGNGNNGTIYGATWVPGISGQALSFNGVNAYVDFGSPAVLHLTTFTLSAWIYVNAFPSAGAITAVGSISTSTASDGYGIQVGNGFVCGTTTSGTAYEYTPAVSISSGAWHFVVIETSGSLFQISVDGGAWQSISATVNPSQTSDFYVGQGFGYFNGIIDEVSVYNRALSTSEIQGYYQSPGFSTNLLAVVPQGTTDFIATLSWQGTGSINVTIQAPSITYTESNVTGIYQKTTYSVSGGTSTMLNIKRLEVSGFSALASNQNWYIVLATSNVQNYQISVEVQS